MEVLPEDGGAIIEATGFLHCFKDLPDTRQQSKGMHLRGEVLLAMLARLAGAESVTDIARFGEGKRALLGRFRPCTDGTPPRPRAGQDVRMRRGVGKFLDAVASAREKITRTVGNDRVDRHLTPRRGGHGLFECQAHRGQHGGRVAGSRSRPRWSSPRPQPETAREWLPWSSMSVATSTMS